MAENELRIKVLYCILDNRCGGPHRLAHAVSQQLRQDHIETVFLLGHKAGQTWRPEGFPSFLCRHIQCFRRQAPVSNFLRFWLALPRNLLYLRRIIKTNDIDLVHVDGVTNFVPALAGRLAGRPVVWLYNDHLPGPLRHLLLPLATALASTIVVQGQCLRQSLTTGRPRLRGKTVVLYSAVDPGRFIANEDAAVARQRIRQELGIPAPCTVIGTVQNVNRLKGGTHFLEAAAEIKKTIAPVRFLVVGRRLDTDAGHWDHLQQLTARLGLERDVIYTGFREDVPAILAALDLFVLASLRESCPVALLEAMAMKVPVVATDVGAVREMVTHDQTGLVVPPGDSAALAQAALAYLTKPQPQVHTMVEAARTKVEQDFTIQTVARQQGQLYERLCHPREKTSSPIRVLYCILDNRLGGPHRRAHAVSQQLRQDHVETAFLLGHKAGQTWRPDGFPSFLCRHIQCFRRQAPVSNFLRFCLALPRNLLAIRKIIKSNDIDIVHVDGVTNFVPALAGRLTGRPVVWLYNDHPPGPLRPILLSLVTALASAVVVQGECLRQSLTAGRPRLRGKTVVLHSAVDPGRFAADQGAPLQRQRLRQELGIPAPCTVIGTVQNVNRIKGGTHFLEAAARIKEMKAPVKFLVIGRKLDTDAGYWDHLQRLTAQLGLEQDVIYTGFRDDIPALLSALDLFVLPSLRESCPVALLEAMAMQVPVVATDVGAVREMVTHGETGLVVPPGDSDALAQAVLAYLAKPQPQVRTMVEAARKRVEQDFAVPSIARQQGQLYERLCRPRKKTFPHGDSGET